MSNNKTQKNECHIALNVGKDLHGRIKKLAEDSERTICAQVRLMLKEWLAGKAKAKKGAK